MDTNKLGPLSVLLGTWVGDAGEDVAPSDDRGTEKNKFREEIVFELLNPVNNHEQSLHGLRYRTTAWPKGVGTPFHEELGYWLWDDKEKQVMKCFMVPRGVTVIAGTTVAGNAREFTMTAKLGSQTYGICSNLFLDREFKTVQYDLKITIIDENTFSYEEDTQLQITGQKDIFHHRDKNLMRRK